MTDNPVAAANARTMWKREIPATPAISSRVKASARWLSMNQSAFWAGFMDDGLHSKRAHHGRFALASFDRSCSHWRLSRNWNRTHERSMDDANQAATCCRRQNYFPPSFVAGASLAGGGSAFFF